MEFVKDKLKLHKLFFKQCGPCYCFRLESPTKLPLSFTSTLKLKLVQNDWVLLKRCGD